MASTIRPICPTPRRSAAPARACAPCASRCRNCCGNGVSAPSRGIWGRRRNGSASPSGAFFAKRPRLYGPAARIRHARAGYPRPFGAFPAPCPSPMAGPRAAIFRRRKAGTFQAQFAARREAMSDRAKILGDIRRALGVTGAEEARRRAVEDRLADPPESVIPRARPCGRPRSTSSAPKRNGCSRPSRRLRQPPTSRRALPISCARKICRRACVGRRSLSRRFALDRDDPDARRRPGGAGRSRRPLSCLRRHRRDGNAGARLRAGQSDDAQLSAGDAYRRRRGGQSTRRLRELLGRACARLMAKARCRAR